MRGRLQLISDCQLLDELPSCLSTPPRNWLILPSTTPADGRSVRQLRTTPQ